MDEKAPQKATAKHSIETLLKGSITPSHWLGSGTNKSVFRLTGFGDKDADTHYAVRIDNDVLYKDEAKSARGSWLYFGKQCYTSLNEQTFHSRFTGTTALTPNANMVVHRDAGQAFFHVLDDKGQPLIEVIEREPGLSLVELERSYGEQFMQDGLSRLNAVFKARTKLMRDMMDDLPSLCTQVAWATLQGAPAADLNRGNILLDDAGRIHLVDQLHPNEALYLDGDLNNLATRKWQADNARHTLQRLTYTGGKRLSDLMALLPLSSHPPKFTNQLSISDDKPPEADPEIHQEFQKVCAQFKTKLDRSIEQANKRIDQWQHGEPVEEFLISYEPRAVFADINDVHAVHFSNTPQELLAQLNTMDKKLGAERH